MPRKDRPSLLGGVHHVMNRGARRHDIFLDDGDRRFFLKQIGIANERFGVKLLAYCLMDNHYHLITSCPEGGLSDSMKLIGENYTRAFNAFHGYDGPLFRGRFTSKLIDSDQYLLDATRYVHRNPLEVGFDICSYPWSSMPNYLANRPPQPWFESGLVLGLAGNRNRYRSFVIADRASDGAPFNRGIRQKEPAPPTGKNTVDASSLDLVVARVSEVSGVPTHDIKVGGRGQTNPARLVAVVLAAESGRHSVPELATYFGIGSAGGFRAVTSRARQRISDRPDVAALWTAVANSV